MCHVRPGILICYDRNLLKCSSQLCWHSNILLWKSAARMRFLIKEDANTNSQSNVTEKHACWNLDVHHKYEKRIFIHQVKYIIWKLIVMWSRKQIRYIYYIWSLLLVSENSASFILLHPVDCNKCHLNVVLRDGYY